MTIAKWIYRLILRMLSPFLDARSERYLRRVRDMKAGDSMRVAFLVFEPETWDKQDPLYRELLKCKDVETDVVVIPSFNNSFKVGTTYGKELDYFKRVCSNVIPAYSEQGILIDFESMGYNYVFYQDSYNRHMPSKLRSYNVVKHSKICYVPYGYSGSAVFESIADNREFYRNVSFGFVDIPEKERQLESSFEKTCKQGLQHFEYLGYPVLEQYLHSDKPKREEDKLSIAWTPRWSYDKTIGGSHFVEYSESFVDMVRENHFDAVLRPHPMMFGELIGKGIMSQHDVSAYCEKLKSSEISLSADEPIRQVLFDADILITDYSSIMVMYFLTGKPMIYCNSNIPFNRQYESMRPGMYIANSWQEVENYVNEIASGNDYLAPIRQEIIANKFRECEGSASRIIERVIADFHNQQ